MPKYKEGAISPSGKFVVQGGKWIERAPSRPMAPGPGASFADVGAWRQDTMGDLGRAEPQTPREVDAGAKGAGIGAAVAGSIAAPVAALKMAGRGAAGYATEEAVDYGLQWAGVSPYWSDKAGDAAGFMVMAGTNPVSAVKSAWGAGQSLVSMLRQVGQKTAGQALKQKAAPLVATIFPKTELEAVQASRALRAAGHSQTEINALIAPVAKVEQKVATTAVKAAAPKPAAVTPPKAPTAKPPVIPPKAPTASESWRVVITHGKNKGQGGVKVKHGMGRGQTRPGGQSGPRHDTIRLDNGTEVTVPSTNVLTDFGKANHPSTTAAIDAARGGASTVTGADVIAGLKAPLTAEEHAIVMQLQGLMKSSANRASIKEIAKTSFGDNFTPIWKFLNSAQTRL